MLFFGMENLSNFIPSTLKIPYKKFTCFIGILWSSLSLSSILEILLSLFLSIAYHNTFRNGFHPDLNFGWLDWWYSLEVDVLQKGVLRTGTSNWKQAQYTSSIPCMSLIPVSWA